MFCQNIKELSFLVMNVSIKQHKRHILEDISSHTTNMTSLAMYRVHCGGGGCCGPESNHAISIYHVSKLNCDNSENQAPRHANLTEYIHPCTQCNVGVEVVVGQRPVMPSVSIVCT